VNAQGGCYGNALQAASVGGNEAIVGLLLERGADVNAQGGFYGNALRASLLTAGHEAIVKLLIKKGAVMEV
jgi:ankyrin repeat protein